MAEQQKAAVRGATSAARVNGQARTSARLAAAALAAVAFAPAAQAQPAAPDVHFDDARAERAATRCLERLGAVPSTPAPGRVHRAQAARRNCEMAQRRSPGPAADQL